VGRGVKSKRGPLGTSATEWPIVPAAGDYDDGEFGGIKRLAGKTEVHDIHVYLWNRTMYRENNPKLISFFSVRDYV
jgi:hypothetical protein